MESLPTLLVRWREANCIAFDAEHLLFEATLDYLAGRAAKPPEQEKERAEQLRGQATALFKQAMTQCGVAQPRITTTKPPAEMHGPTVH
jgi:hypothetical protein